MPYPYIIKIPVYNTIQLPYLIQRNTFIPANSLNHTQFKKNTYSYCYIQFKSFECDGLRSKVKVISNAKIFPI